MFSREWDPSMLWSSGCRFCVVWMGWEGRRNGEEIGREGSRKPRSEGFGVVVGHVENGRPCWNCF